MSEHPSTVGFSFGSTSGIITTLGLMVGLNAGTNSRIAVIGGILTIAIADAFSDGLGIHVSEESEAKHTQKEIWIATLATFFWKFIISISFLVPILLLELSTALVVSVIWGLGMLSVFSCRMAMKQGDNPWKVVTEHLVIAVVVITITCRVGIWISRVFG